MITVKTWKDISSFDPLEGGKLNVEGTVKRIAMVTGKSIKEVENMPVSELLPEFLKCVETVNKEVFAKIGNMPKNG